MPRKTKEQNNIEKEKKEEKGTATKTTAKKSEARTTKKATTPTTEKATTKKATTSTAKKATTKKVATSTAKKVATKKTSTSTAKKATTKKATTSTAKKTTTKKASSTITKKTVKASTKKKAEKNMKTKEVKKEKVEILEYYDLPYRYNQTIVKILAQTPTTLFVYWDISDDDREAFKKQYGDNFFETTKPILIVHNDTMGYSFEVEINDFANSWYLHVNDTKCDYRVELGRHPIIKNEKLNTDYIYISTSNKIESPNDHILFNIKPEQVYFKNIQTGIKTSKNIASLTFLKNIEKLYNVQNLYKALYKNENIEEIYDLSNPSSRNPGSSSLSSPRFI